MSSFDSINIVRFVTVSINFPGLINEGKKSILESLKNDLALSWLVGLTYDPRNIWNKSIINEYKIIIFINVIFFIPLLQYKINSLLASYWDIVKNKAIKKEKGKILCIIFGKL